MNRCKTGSISPMFYLWVFDELVGTALVTILGHYPPINCPRFSFIPSTTRHHVMGVSRFNSHYSGISKGHVQVLLSNTHETTRIFSTLYLFNSFMVFFFLLGHTCQCSSVTPGSVLKNHFWQAQGTYRMTESKPRSAVLK